MKSELKVFGRRLNMAPRANRRLLVVILYGVLASLMVWSWMTNPKGAVFLTIGSGTLLGPILGGVFYGKYYLFGSGLVEPFNGNEILDQKTRSRWARLFYPEIGDEREIRNDERAIRRRDHAHFMAFRFVGGLAGLGFLIKFAEATNAFDIVSAPGRADRIVFCLLQICWVCFMSLPQAILLWTEPDMEEAHE